MTEGTMTDVRSRFVVVDGIRTHYLEAGEGPTVVLLHAGGFGENAERSWRFNIGPLADRYRVVAPDWLGFGQTDKLRDFVDGNGRMVRHMARFFEVMDITEADVMGLSMGGTFLVRIASSERPVLPIRRMVLVSGGGFSPDNEARQVLQSYDGTMEGMRRQVRVVFHDPKWADDDDNVKGYYEASLEPGAWEFAASARFRSPVAPPRSDFGNVDTTPYENVRVPTLLTAGAQDQLREPGYADELHRRVPGSEVILFDRCGHCPNVEHADAWNEAVLDFLARTPPLPS